MAIKCIETGKIYPSAAAAARAVNVSPAAMTHHLKGRQKSCGGHRFEKFKSSHPDHVVKRHKRPIRDDAGNVYDTYDQLAAAKGISRNMAFRHVNRDPERKFRNAVLRENVCRLRLGFDGRHWTIDDAPHVTRAEAVAALRRVVAHFPVTLAHRMLDKARHSGHTVTMYFGPTGWTVDNGAGDLFNEF